MWCSSQALENSYAAHVAFHNILHTSYDFALVTHKKISEFAKPRMYVHIYQCEYRMYCIVVTLPHITSSLGRETNCNYVNTRCL
jgi:hypothetical protein